MSQTEGLRPEDKAIIDVVDAYNKAIDDNILDEKIRDRVKDAAAANIYTAILSLMLDNHFKSMFGTTKKENEDG